MFVTRDFQFGFLHELIACKVNGENAPVGDVGWSFHASKLGELAAQLDVAFEQSSLPEDRDRKPIHDFLVGLRLGSSRGGT